MTPRHPTGTYGACWIEYDSPKPLAVDDYERHWVEAPPGPSPRCEWWLRQIERGWRPSRRVATMGYHGSCIWFGVWMWEYVNRIYPALRKAVLEAER